jgi:hypothetical protein
LPSLFQIGKYKVFFWSDENHEPIHVHVCVGKPSPNATKFWLTSRGKCILAHNAGRIPEYDLNELMEFISAQYFLICRVWKSHHRLDSIRYFC